MTGASRLRVLAGVALRERLPSPSSMLVVRRFMRWGGNNHFRVSGDPATP